ncbi:MAG: signal peptidase I [Saccharofermentanales bacterium]|jgi:signal peptidase I|nr:signal peptidase I [Clostridiaceae bacterium]
MTDIGNSKSQNKGVLLELLDWLKYILIAFLIGLLMVVFVVQRNSVVGDSMKPALYSNDQLLVEKISKLGGWIGYEDIVTIKTDELRGHEGGPNIIKRVVGQPGDTIEIREGLVYRNGQPLDESNYLAPGIVTEIRKLDYAKITLADDEYYVLGDNREISLDSRTFGPVRLQHIIGRVLIRFYPFDRVGSP